MPSTSHDVVSNAIGDFGLWQARGFFLIALTKIPAGWHMLSVLFLAPPPYSVHGDFWCARPSEYWDIHLWINYSHPTKITLQGDTHHDACHIYDKEYSEKPENLVTYSTNKTLACKFFEFEQPYPSMVTQWQLVCDQEVLANVSQLAYLIGILLGGIIQMLLVKKLSPRFVLVTGGLLQVLAGVASALTPFYIIHLIFKLLTGLGACIMFSSGLQILFEITGNWQKTVVGVIYEHYWSIGVISLGPLSDVAGSWINLQLIISIPTILIVLLARWIPDSPRWYLSKGKTKKAEEILRYAANMNGREFPADFKTAIKSFPEEHEKEVLPKFKIIALLILWIITVFNYYGALLNMRNIGGPRLAIRTSIAGLIEVLGASIGMFLLLRSKPPFRFTFLSVLLTVGGLAGICSWAIPPNAGNGRGGWTLLTLAMIGRVGIACSLAILAAGGSEELIPVSRRPVTLLCLMSTARLVLEIAPFMNVLSYISESVVLTLYGITMLTGAVAAFVLSLMLVKEVKESKKQLEEHAGQ